MRRKKSTCTAVVALMLGVFLPACGSSQEVATRASTSQAQRSGERPDSSLVCPDAAPANPEDAAPPPDTRVVVLSGDFDGYPWCLVVETSSRVGTCISIEGAAAVDGKRLPEGEQLLSGACDGPITGLRWYLTTGPASAPVIFGYAPPDATSVRFETEGSEVAELEVHASPSFDGATFFTGRLPRDQFPDAAVALRGDQEIERKSAPQVTTDG